jgi:NAD(P)-dependent dehydrogenase (short-subunit alcohol dehydrogenase family)
MADVRVCVVTGASRGIGRAVALRLARAGFAIVGAARSPEPLAQLRREVEALGAACETVAADVGTEEGAARVIDAARRRFGRIDVLVNNAGLATLLTTAEAATRDYRALLAANVDSAFLMTHHAWPLLAASHGAVISVSSMASADPFPGLGLYGACKAWVNLFTKAIAGEGRPVGIRAFAVAPGAVETDMLRGAFPDFPAGAALDPDDVAQVIESLADSRMKAASGATIFVQK